MQMPPRVLSYKMKWQTLQKKSDYNSVFYFEQKAMTSMCYDLKRSSKKQGVFMLTIKPARFSPPSPPISEVGQTRAEGKKSKEESLYLALAGNISPHQCVGDQ